MTNKGEKGAVQRAATGAATSANKAEKGAVQNGYTGGGIVPILMRHYRARRS